MLRIVGKRGCLAPVHNVHTMRGALAFHKAVASLGSPPVVMSDYVTAVHNALGGDDWGMLGNDMAGDCTLADSGHQIMVHSANAGKMVQPTTEQCFAAYSAIAGWVQGNAATDTGCDETAVCNYMQSTGIAGQKSAGHGMLDPSQLDHIRWTAQIFGACRLGIIVDSAMEELFSEGKPWEVPAAANDPSAGGHDVPIVKYDAEYAYVVTWGRLQPITWALIAQAAFLQEAHVEAYPDFVRVGGTAPSGFNLDGLLAEMPLLVAA